MAPEPRSETINDREAFDKTFPPKDESPRVVQWSAENHCYTVNGVEAAIPISTVQGQTNTEQESASPGVSESSKKKRKTKTGDEKEFFFEFFKFPNRVEEYLLEIHHDEVKTGGIDRFHVSVKEGRICRVLVHDLAVGDHVVLRVLHDPTNPVFKKTRHHSLEYRLTGWTREKRGRENGKQDKFYYHHGRQFRSFVDVITFVLYSCGMKELIKVNTTNNALQKAPEIEAADEALMVTISSSNIKNSFRK